MARAHPGPAVGDERLERFGVVDRKNAHELKRRELRLIRVDGSRHFIMADQPERFAALVDAFLAD